MKTTRAHRHQRIRQRRNTRPESDSDSVRPGTRQRSPYNRMITIYNWMKDGKYPNATTIAVEMEVSTKTAHRDLECMQDIWKLPMAYNNARRGYYFTGPPDQVPGVPMSEKEMFSLFIAQKAIEKYQGTPFHQPLTLAYQKLTSSLDDRARYTIQNMGEALSFRPFAPDDADLLAFELVTQAVTDRRALKFQYRKPGEKSPSPRHVHPYHVMEFENRWYLLAHDLDRGAIRTFVLGRMLNPVVTPETFDRPRNFNPKAQFDGSLGVMAGQGNYEVVIEMDAWLTDILRGRRWHSSQEWTEMPSGGSRLRLRLSSLDEVEQWILSWGTHAHVVRPAALVERLAKTVEVLSLRYPKPETLAAENSPLTTTLSLQSSPLIPELAL